MTDQKNPYQALPPRHFWLSAVVEPGPLGVTDLVDPGFRITRQDRVVTAGSCFAQRLRQVLVARGFDCPIAEPAPPMLDPGHHARFNYGVYSARTGNIYTPAMLRQWLGWAPDDLETWDDGGRVQDAFRPGIEPGGFADLAEARRARSRTLDALRRSLGDATVFVFTLGQTEAWRNRRTGLIYSSCPGTVAGRFDPDLHELVNFEYPQLYEDLAWSLDRLRALNPALKIILTVSPVPLTATAEPQGHALVANCYSKSVLRAVAGSLARRDGVDYFPSYELVTAPPFRGMFYAPNMRTVDPWGVRFIMDCFVGLYGCPEDAAPQGAPARDDEDLVCDDFILDYYNGA